MKKQLLFCLAFCSYIVVFNIYGQSAQLFNSSIMENEQVKSYKIDASERLENFSKALGIDYSKLGKPANNLLKTSAWNFTVGSQKNWNASDLSVGSSSFYSVPSTCRKVGTNCYIFVEDAVWTNGRVTIDAVNKVAEAFDSKTPANANKGIYFNNVEAFGNVPNIDGDAKIIILILDIKDGYDPQKGGGYIAGYFHGYHQYPKSQAASSNEAEIYFLDANPVNLLTDSGVNSAMSTTAHEFQHMIHFNYLPASETFLNEAWSLIAEVLNGYPLYSQSGYQGETNTYLLEWRRNDATAVLKDYSRAAKFALYLKEQIGTTIFKKYLENKVSGLPGLSNVMTIMGYSRTLSEVINDWFIANTLNNKTINSKWGYDYIPISKNLGKTIIEPTQTESFQFASLSSQYYTFSNGKNLKGTITASDPNGIKITAIKYTANSAVVEELINKSSFSFPDFGTVYNKITLIFSHSNVNASNSGSFYSVNMNTTGESSVITQELKYDDGDTKPVLGAWNLSVGDTIAVLFDAAPGLKLKKIIVGLRNDKSITGGIYRQSAQSPCATLISSPITLTGKSTPSAPFSIPWPNLVEYDLSSQNIDLSLPFTVAFGYKGTTGNNVVIVEHTPSEYYHSRTYLTNPSSGSPGWYYLSLSSTAVGLYIIRAVATNTLTGVDEEVELLPSSFSLSQNYPNPFNPSTVINYNLPKAEFVTLKVYDIVGKEVATLVNEYQQAGVHNSQFSIINSQLSSGIYFYTINAGNFNQTKKMILIK